MHITRLAIVSGFLLLGLCAQEARAKSSGCNYPGNRHPAVAKKAPVPSKTTAGKTSGPGASAGSRSSAINQATFSLK